MSTAGKLVAAAALTAALSSAHAAATITLINFDGAGEGLNDPTPVAPVGGNVGTTLGQQRINALLFAAGVWAQALNSPVPITIRVSFDTNLTCTVTGATLASAGTRFVIGFSSGAPFLNTWYHASLANKIAGVNTNPGVDQGQARFNSNLGAANCLAGSPFYLGLDGNEGTGVDLVTTAIHEFGHALGFAAITSNVTGARFNGVPAVWEHFLRDLSSGKKWIDMSDTERQASAINFRRLVWEGPNVTAGVPSVLTLGSPRLAISGPAAGPAAGDYPIGTASYGPALSAPGVTAQVMPVVAQAGELGNGCSAFNAVNALAVNGRIALIARGGCGFVNKIQNAQNAGAVGVIITDNVAGSPTGLGGTPTQPITIPSVRVSLADGNRIRAQLATRSRTASGVIANLGVNPNQFSGADIAGRMLMNTPDPVVPGSSVSHWDPIALRDLIMEPAATPGLTADISPPVDLTMPLMRDIGW